MEKSLRWLWVVKSLSSALHNAFCKRGAKALIQQLHVRIKVSEFLERKLIFSLQVFGNGVSEQIVIAYKCNVKMRLTVQQDSLHDQRVTKSFFRLGLFLVDKRCFSPECMLNQAFPINCLDWDRQHLSL